MDIFDSIKDTLLSVPKGITTGIKALSTHDSVREVTGEAGASGGIPVEIGRDTEIVQELNYDASAELLTKFQNAWSDMHQRSETNAKQAKLGYKKIQELSSYFDKQNDAVGLFLQEISTLPQLLHDLQTATELIQNLEQQFEVVESELIKLEDTCERQELRRNMHHHEYQLMAYKQRRAVELEKAKVKMAKNHAAKVQRYEYNLQKGLREKQQAFEASFKEEMYHYKKYGKPSKQLSVHVQDVSSTKDVDLSNFVPETDGEDEALLNEFLQTDTASDGDNVEAAADLDCKLENSDRLQTSTTTDNCQRQDDASNIDRDVETDNGSEEATSNVHPSIPEPHKQSNSVTEEAVKEDTDQPDAT
ncbi:hypothetical protein LSH36_270g03046 [Paralvinella palmiformis]|uniref:Uncharacterized protein n=1 Tax=Paralvinella palmiformis TaxID=53620 RepID=A0AAD9JJR4_9ANNE|nr:hypothetical protein LSH36_270g03046 [Paralvinella palmiformis]